MVALSALSAGMSVSRCCECPKLVLISVLAKGRYQ